VSSERNAALGGHRHIVVEGPIGVGKTSLARRLGEDFGAELVLEGPEANPFLERFYRDPRGVALPTQLFFLFQRVEQVKAMRQSDMFSPVRVTDFLLEKDPLFAEVNLDPDEFHLYRQVWNHLSVDAPDPDLVIYLQAPADVLLERVRRRNIPWEQEITREYLGRLVDAYARFFHHYDRAPLLIVNAATLNPVDSETDYRTLVDVISRTRSGRHFFNPGGP
jgi:deoxyguanosine kinase